jgi:hypothetical protein
MIILSGYLSYNMLVEHDHFIRLSLVQYVSGAWSFYPAISRTICYWSKVILTGYLSYNMLVEQGHFHWLRLVHMSEEQGHFNRLSLVQHVIEASSF